VTGCESKEKKLHRVEIYSISTEVGVLLMFERAKGMQSLNV